VSSLDNNIISPPLQVKKTNDLINLSNPKKSKISKISPMPHSQKSPTKNPIQYSPSYQNPIKLMQQDEEDYQ